MAPDELLTYALAQLPDLGAVWTTLKIAPTTVDPPLNPFISFLAFRLPLPVTLALRIPAILSYAAMMLSVFVLVRRRASPVVALLAFALPMVLPISAFSIQNRPYALWLGASGWSLACWQSAASERRRVLSLLGLYFCLTAAILSQYVGSLIFIPLIAGELWRSREKGLDIPIWLTLFAGAISIVAYAPLLGASSLYRLHPWHGVSVHDLEDTFLSAISAVVLVLIVLSTVVRFVAKQTDNAVDQPTSFYSAEWIALLVLYSIPVVMFIFARIVTKSYVPRYSAIFGIAAVCLTAALIFELTKHIRGLAAIMLIVLFLRAAIPPGIPFQFAQQTDGITANLPPTARTLPHLPIAVPLWNPYLRIYLFGPNEFKRRMLLVWNPNQLTEFGNNGALANAAVQRTMHAPFALAPEFFRSNRDFLLLGDYALLNPLVDEGWTVTVLGHLYLWPIYRVTAK
jgi:hypothetical protein